MATGVAPVQLFRQLMFSFRVAENTISLFVPKVLEALISMTDEVMPPLVEPEQWKEVSDKFQARWNFPDALDGEAHPHQSSTIVRFHVPQLPGVFLHDPAGSG